MELKEQIVYLKDKYEHEINKLSIEFESFVANESSKELMLTKATKLKTLIPI